MKFAILGSGGVGGYFGARLAAAGSDVTFVARGRHLEAMRKNGLRVTSALGDVVIDNPKAVDDIRKVGDVDLVIVAVKLWDTESAAESLKSLAAQGAGIVSFQNGVHKDETMRKYLPEHAIIGGVCYIAAVISEPGVIAHSGTMQKLTFGEYDGSNSPRVQAFYEACTEAGITAEISSNIRRLIWEKFVFLVGLSGTTASIRKPIGPIRENKRTRAFLLDVMSEVVEVGRAKGVDLPAEFAQDRLAFCDGIPATMTSSMHHDLERGNRMELPWLSGGVSDFGKDLGIATPKNDAIREILELYVAGTVRK
ncbi:2-dehydropantoate 2-reductase [Paraburkholderia caribensis MBA4]|uniref:2-dehydropantoate 2-reductase n=1 Tax=Paraburkholderia caribensis MBA4 TaxID=1323664 RepID=A0A0P0RIA9_9BURK|nr:2-dehydropantoate 2-reductase [Paraburkholderia caribensis]ALL68347.1 2-dehydropantoate 2-reductase [Paraburkholderia caribensis MBA4]